MTLCSVSPMGHQWAGGAWSWKMKVMALVKNGGKRWPIPDVFRMTNEFYSFLLAHRKGGEAPPCGDLAGGVRRLRSGTYHWWLYGRYHRSFRVFVPADYDSGAEGPLPLVLVLHGAFNNANLMAEETQYEALCQTERCIAIFPNGTNIFSGLFTFALLGVGVVGSGYGGVRYSAMRRRRAAGVDEATYLRVTEEEGENA